MSIITVWKTTVPVAATTPPTVWAAVAPRVLSCSCSVCHSPALRVWKRSNIPAAGSFSGPGT